jgi:formate dehydrogenase subunit gamma
MTKLTARLRIVLSALALLAFAALAHSALAQQPQGIVDPNAKAVSESQLLQHSGTISGLGSIPDTKSYTIEQVAGQAWRYYHEVTLRWIGAVVILGVLALLVFFYLTRGMIRIENGRSGRKIVRFNAYERFVHWLLAVCFVLLALSGLNITFGRPLLLPLMSPEAFSTLSAWAKYAHNYLSFPFTLGVILMFFMWVADNLPTRVDIDWLKRGGGMIGHDQPPAYRFNGGQKILFWIVFLGGGAAAISGYILIFPFYGTDIHAMQLAEVGHSIIAMLFIGTMLAHIYIGTIGMEGAFEAMGEGTVDLNWVKEHHSLWLEEENARAQRSPPPDRATPQPGE